MFKQKYSYHYTMLPIVSMMIYFGEHFFPERSKPEELQVFKVLYDPFNIEAKWGTAAKWFIWWFITCVTMNVITWNMYLVMKWLNPQKMPKTHFWTQAKVILINFA
jgi:hypothetical protein